MRGLPRANGQVECLNCSIIPIFTKLAMDDPTKWYQYIDKLQSTINLTYCRSINTAQFHLLFGTKIRTKSDEELNKLIEKEMLQDFQ